MLLDCAHLALYQRVMGHQPFDGLDGFPLDRVVELHVAGGTEHTTEGLSWVDDDHGTQVLPEVWDILRTVVERAPNLKAVVVECERNPIDSVLPLFERVRQQLAGTAVVQA